MASVITVAPEGANRFGIAWVDFTAGRVERIETTAYTDAELRVRLTELGLAAVDIQNHIEIANAYRTERA